MTIYKFINYRLNVPENYRLIWCDIFQTNYIDANDFFTCLFLVFRNGFEAPHQPVFESFIYFDVFYSRLIIRASRTTRFTDINNSMNSCLVSILMFARS